MNIRSVLLATLFSLSLLVVGASTVQAAGWVDHKFLIELPDGTKKDLKGAKMHIFHKQHEQTGAEAFTNTCYYPDKNPINENPNWGALQANIGDYHCSTPQSCTIIDYGAPFLPKDFNANRYVYEQGNASYFAFHDNKTFTEALRDDWGFRNLANIYKEGNIRGFDGAKWEGTVNFSEDDSKGPVAIVRDQGEIDRELNARSDWGTKGFDGQTNRWGPGEVYKDPQGGNALHGQITWVLKPPTPQAEKPTASLTGKCANNSPGIPTYTFTLSNISPKDAPFVDNHLYLKVPKSNWTDEFKSIFGPPIYEDAGTTDYSLIYNTAQPVNGSVVMTVLGTEKIGNKPENTKTVADLVKWMDARRGPGGVIPTLTVATNLQLKVDGTDVLNSQINSTFQPKFTNNECGTPPVAGPMCVSIKMINLNNAEITNYKALRAGDAVKFECGNVAGVSNYAFRVVKFNAQNVQTGIVSLTANKSKANQSELFDIPREGGKFLAQCALCPNGQCQAFEPTSYVERPSTGGTPGVQSCTSINSNYSCVTPQGCEAGKTIEGACPTAGQVCCTSRTRDETPAPSTPTPTPASTACVSPNSCTTAAGCLTIAAGKTCGSGQVCCADRVRDETPPPATATPVPGTPRPRDE